MAARAAPLTERMFVAVWPPAPVADAVASAVAALRTVHPIEAEALRWTASEQWHVTLRFLGSADRSLAVPAFRSVARSGRLAPATAEMGPVTGRFGRRVLQVPVGGLAALASAVTDATALVGERPEDRVFAGHLTLARARSRGGAGLAPFTGHALSARWAVEDLTLVASRPGPGGAHYEVVDVLHLEGPCPNTRSQLH